MLILMGIFTMMWARNSDPTRPTIYISGLFTALIGLNTVYSAFTAVNADFVPKRQMGLASGVMAILQLTGSCTGFALLTFLIEVHDAYVAYALSTVGGILITCLAIAPMEEPADAPLAPISWEELGACYTITPNSHGDFFWVFTVRLFYYLSMSIQVLPT